MDEPLGALDKQLREKMQFEITALAHRLGITVVYVTHDQTEALTMSDRVAVFNDGRIQQLATPDQLYEEPENSFVAQFIGENNTLNGTVKGLKNDIAKVELDSGDIIDCKPVNVSVKAWGKGRNRLVSRVLPCFRCLRSNGIGLFILDKAFTVLVELPVRPTLFFDNG